MSGVRRVPGEGPWEEVFGAARAVAAGDRVLVSGTTPFDGTVLYGEGDPYEQTRVALTRAVDALAEFGLDAASVLRTRLYLAHTRDLDEAARAHQELFGAVRPATTVVVVSGFVDPRILVQVELEAFAGPEGFRAPIEGASPS
ncbi:Rid family hydrolase [Streptomyces sp. NPDC047117]|uniref:Rid family hydrolase n=1 Tax=unclassified Streptomyces TaxID=2593676 RepID=UPI00340AE94C